jgi:hypothetical protein
MRGFGRVRGEIPLMHITRVPNLILAISLSMGFSVGHGRFVIKTPMAYLYSSHF